MYTKRLILILTFFVSLINSQNVAAQKPILGLTLGKTTVEEATLIIQDRGLQMTHHGIGSPNNTFYGNNIRFGGITWRVCMLLFEQNHFTSATFCLGDLQESNAKSYFDTLSEALKRNYPDFSHQNDDRDNFSRLSLKRSNLEYVLKLSKSGDHWRIELDYIYTGRINPSKEMNEL